MKNTKKAPAKKTTAYATQAQQPLNSWGDKPFPSVRVDEAVYTWLEGGEPMDITCAGKPELSVQTPEQNPGSAAENTRLHDAVFEARCKLTALSQLLGNSPSIQLEGNAQIGLANLLDDIETALANAQ